MKFHGIVMMSKNGAIGYDNNFLTNQQDLIEHYQKIIHNKNLVIGRKSYEKNSFFQQEKNIFLLSKVLKNEKTFSNLIDLLKNFKNKNIEEVYIVGGESIFDLFYPLLSELHLFVLNEDYQGDVFFKNYQSEEWLVKKKSLHPHYNYLNCSRI